MKFKASQIPYHTTGLFSQLVRDYVDGKGTALDFTNYAPNLQGVQKALEARKGFSINRPILVEVLKAQYANLDVAKKVHENIDLLSKDNTYVITTAHQPNIFTGPLYFFYKILHAIQISFRHAPGRSVIKSLIFFATFTSSNNVYIKTNTPQLI